MVEFDMVKIVKKVDVSIIFVYYRTPREILSALSSLKSAVNNLSFEVIIIDNNSPENFNYSRFRDLNIRYIKNRKNKGYGSALNQGVRLSKGKFLVLSNSDVIYKKNSIFSLVKLLSEDKSIGIVGPQFLDSKNKIQKVGTGIPTPFGSLFYFTFINKMFPDNRFSSIYFLKSLNRKKENEMPAICGACLVISKSVFNQVKGFDENFFLYFEEVDLCLKIKNIGLKVMYYPESHVIHFIGKSSSDLKEIRKYFEESRLIFLKKYYGNSGIISEYLIRLLNI